MFWNPQDTIISEEQNFSGETCRYQTGLFKIIHYVYISYMSLVNNKLFWNYVSKNSKTKKSVTKLLMPNGNLTSSDQETANTLNEYFSSVFTNENETNIPNFEDRNFNEILDEILITEKKVEDAIKILKPSKSQ